jgi:hypothetical protein
MTKEDLSRLVSAEIDDARRYLGERTGTNFGGSTTLPMGYNMAHKFMRGEVDIPAEVGKSAVTSRDLSDVLGWVMPGLLRVFLASDRVVQYEANKPKLVPQSPAQDPQGNLIPQPPKDISKDLADQATDYVNYTFLTECGGYNVLQSAIYDALLLGNGLIKHWWDDTPEWEIEGPFTGLSDEQFTQLVMEPDVEVIEHSAESVPGIVGGGMAPGLSGMAEGGPVQPAGISGAPVQDMGFLGADAGGPEPDPGAGESSGQANSPPASGIYPVLGSQIPGPKIHSVKIRRKVSQGRLRVEALPPENFLIERNAKMLDENVRFAAHAYQATRSDLIEMGFDFTRVDELAGSAYDIDQQGTMDSRGDTTQLGSPLSRDRSTEIVDVFECYCLADYDGDGVAERYKVIMGGGIGERQMLHAEPWPDELPFSDLVPDPVPHRWRGHSLFDELYDIVRIKTALLRQTQDNLYQTNNPANVVLDGQVLNMDALINRTLGANIFAKRPDAVTPLAVPFTAEASFAMLEYWDRVIERRTGVSQATMAMDAEALQNQTATAVNAAQAAATSKSEFWARNMAETGLKRVFRNCLKLHVRHPDQQKMIQLRGEWVPIDPRQWDPEMDVSINTGLGTGNRDRDVAMIGLVTQKQEQILQLLGPDNPVVDLKLYRDTLAKGIEAANLRHPDHFFKEVTDESLQRFAQAQAQRPDPKMAEAQAKMQLEGLKAQHDAGMREAELQQKTMLERERAALEMQTARDKAAAELNIMREQAALKLQLAREEAVQNWTLKQRELELEAELKREEMKIQRAAMAQSANIQEARPQ